ncbi:uncharacterized protein [Elaeis guineensis]|uniref:Uncharacterized protein LOC105033076 n=1 Tax=Elaeis guineensis var. tenera TaxID=51953 RepID=A0A6I9QAF9_ELAGV|nr:uncharacterized protein LOC105033076 [Elaeis guineensis]
MSSPSPSKNPAESQTVAPATDSSPPPPPPPPSDQGGESSGDSERPNSVAAGGDGEKNGGEGEAGDVGEGHEDEEEEGECGFCLFMKGGGCKEEFIAWEKCVEEADQTGEDVVSKCFEVTSLLKKCMDAHADYYAPILDAEKAMTEAATTATTTPDSE